MASLTGLWIYDCVFILICILIGIYLYITRNFKYWEKRDVKQITPLPFFGNIAPFLFHRKPFVDVCQDFYEAAKNHPYIGLYFLNKPYLLICDPELIKHVLIKDFNYFTSRMSKSARGDIIGNMNLFIVKNPEWKNIRQKISPIFTTRKLKKMVELMLTVEQDFLQYLDSLKLEGDGRSVEVKEICAKYTTDIIGLIGYGLEFGALTNKDSVIRKVGKDIFKKSYLRFLELSSTILLPSLVETFRFMMFGKEATNFLRDIFWEAIEQRLRSNKKREDLLDLLIDIKKNQEENCKADERKYDDDELVAQAAVFFTGGFETSSTTMSFALHELAKHPEIQEQLRNEILDELSKNDGKITYEMLSSSLPYLDMVVSETLRMYPILPFLDRVTESNYQVPNSPLIIEAGTPVIIPTYSLHMDEHYFPKPHIFDPLRFSVENKKLIKPNTYFPFGDGPRICIGMRLGLLQTKLGLLHLLSNYEFSLCKETQTERKFDKFTFLLSFPNDVILNVKKR